MTPPEDRVISMVAGLLANHDLTHRLMYTQVSRFLQLYLKETHDFFETYDFFGGIDV